MWEDVLRNESEQTQENAGNDFFSFLSACVPILGEKRAEQIECQTLSRNRKGKKKKISDRIVTHCQIKSNKVCFCSPSDKHSSIPYRFHDRFIRCWGATRVFLRTFPMLLSEISLHQHTLKVTQFLHHLFQHLITEGRIRIELNEHLSGEIVSSCCSLTQV